MASFWSRFGFNVALGENLGTQNPVPGLALVPDSANIGPDTALQISAVWSCIDRRASTIASLPFFAYTTRDGQRELARSTRLFELLHDSPNSRMTPYEFWRAMMLNHDLRGNAYARIDRDGRGEAMALWPMPADQVEVSVLDDGSMVYKYQMGNDIAILAEKNVLHLKNLGNGTTGLSKLEFMRATTDEAAKAQGTASKVFGTGGKPTGVLMLDKVLTKEQREKIKESFAGMAEGSTSRLFVLEASMKYEQLSMSPEQQQLLETRNFTVSEICRWFDVPPVLVHHNDTTTWGSGIEQIVDGFYKLSIRPMLVSIEQATRKRVMTASQRSFMSAEFSLDALLRGNPTQRAELYAKNVQNGIMTRNECRQLENLPPSVGANELTAQSNLLPLVMLGQVPAQPKEVPKDPVLQSMATFNAEQKSQDRKERQERQDQQHSELLKAIYTQPKPPQDLKFNLGGVSIQVEKSDSPTPIVNVTNQVNPTPVEVNVKNDVSPTPVEVSANFEAVLQPAEVILSMPSRKTVGTVERDEKGNIVKTTQIESDAQ